MMSDNKIPQQHFQHNIALIMALYVFTIALIIACQPKTSIAHIRVGGKMFKEGREDVEADARSENSSNVRKCEKDTSDF